MSLENPFTVDFVVPNLSFLYLKDLEIPWIFMEMFVFMFAANLGMKLHHFAASTAVQYVLLRAVIKGRGWDWEFLLATVKVNPC